MLSSKLLAPTLPRLNSRSISRPGDTVESNMLTTMLLLLAPTTNAHLKYEVERLQFRIQKLWAINTKDIKLKVTIFGALNSLICNAL